MRKVNIAVLGTGYWGKKLIRNLYSTEGAEIIGICDLSAENIHSTLGIREDVRIFADYSEMLKELKPEAVIIATPAGLHYEHAALALEAHCHVFVEKPLCTSVEDAQLLVRLGEDKNRLLMVGHTFLYNNILHQVKKYIQSGELGEIYYIYATRVNMGRIRDDVDALWNFAPHDISICNYLMDGLPHQVSGTGMCYIQKKKNIIDVAFAQLNYSQGRNAHIHVSWLDPNKKREVVVVGDKKMLVYDDVNTDRCIQIYDKCFEKELKKEKDFADFKAMLRAGNLVIPNINLQEPLAVEMGHFVECVRDDKVPHSDGKSGLAVVEIIEAISQSIKDGGRSVYL